MVFIVVACISLTAQTFEVGSPGDNRSTKPRQKSQQRSQSADSGMGWGSSIGVAREARAAREALQRNEFKAAESHAARAANSAPQNSDFWFLYAYAARLAGDYSNSVDAYNRAIGSLESRVLVTARRLKDSGISAPEPLPELSPIDQTARPLGAPELVGLFDDDPVEGVVVKGES
jgi:hypothetical protein